MRKLCFVLLLAVSLRAETIAYVAGGSSDQTMDVHWTGETPRATVLFIHGGSLQESGERRDSAMYRDVCRPFVAANIACATMDYRLAPQHPWPAMPDDVVSAVVALRRIAGERGADPQKIFLFGHSSGCHLAAIVATNPEYLRRVHLTPRDLGGFIAMGCTLDREDAALRGLTADRIRTPFANDPQEVATYKTPERWLSANPASFLGPHVPPALVVVAEEERFMPPILEQGGRFVRRLLEHGVRADLVIVPGTHVSSIADLGPAFAAMHRLITGAPPASTLEPFSGKGQARVLFLGMFHFQDAGLDAYKPKHEFNVMAPERQQEIAELVERIATRFAPTKIGIEVKADQIDTINQRYRDYLAGTYELKANEIYQIAFRLAKRLDHAQLHAIDVLGRRYEGVDVEAAAKELGQQALLEPEWWKTYTKLYEHDDVLKSRLPLRDFLRYINSPERVQAGHGVYLTGTFHVGRGANYTGADSLTGWWYNRNLRIFENVLRLVESPRERVFVLIGAGHLPVLLHAAESSPEVEVVSAEEVLRGGD